MMRIIFSVYDAKAEAFLTPIFVTAEGVATRSFGAACQDPAHDFNKFSEDYVLFKLGLFDESIGAFDLLGSPVPVVTAAVMKQQKENGRA